MKKQKKKIGINGTNNLPVCNFEKENDNANIDRKTSKYKKSNPSNLLI